jgi:hypothetical protein
MSRKKIDPEELLEETNGPMNSVAKEDAEVWAARKSGIDYNEKQIKRIAVAKKKKAKISSKKDERRKAKQAIRYIEGTTDE